MCSAAGPTLPSPWHAQIAMVGWHVTHTIRTASCRFGDHATANQSVLGNNGQHQQNFRHFRSGTTAKCNDNYSVSSAVDELPRDVAFRSISTVTAIV